MKVFFVEFLKNYPDAYLESRQTCKMELFVKIVNGLKILTIHKKQIKMFNRVLNVPPVR